MNATTATKEIECVEETTTFTTVVDCVFVGDVGE
jgi:hypothetical protein